MLRHLALDHARPLTYISVPVNPNSTCDCITHALWQRNLEWTRPEMREDDLMMISESDVLITSDKVMEPLAGNFRAWVYWSETGLYGGQTFAMSFTTLSKRDWRLLLNNSQAKYVSLLTGH